jgi:hypothetical protein
MHAVIVLNKSVSLFASVCIYAGSVDTVRYANCYSQTPNAVRLVVAVLQYCSIAVLQYCAAFSDMNEKHIKKYYGPRID